MKGPVDLCKAVCLQLALLVALDGLDDSVEAGLGFLFDFDWLHRLLGLLQFGDRGHFGILKLCVTIDYTLDIEPAALEA